MTLALKAKAESERLKKEHEKVEKLRAFRAAEKAREAQQARF